jgi:hypothetical protein
VYKSGGGQERLSFFQVSVSVGRWVDGWVIRQGSKDMACRADAGKAEHRFSVG